MHLQRAGGLALIAAAQLEYVSDISAFEFFDGHFIQHSILMHARYDGIEFFLHNIHLSILSFIGSRRSRSSDRYFGEG